MLKEITTFLIGLSLGPPWVRDENCFAGHIPVRNINNEETENMRYLAILETGAGSTIGEWPDYVEKAVQLLNRAATYFTARDDAEELYDELHGTSGWELPVVSGGPQFLACVIDANGPPAPIANPDDAGLFVFSTNYVWKIEEASCGA